MDNIQQIADAVQKGLELIVRASVQQGRTKLTRLRNELYSDSFESFHAVLSLEMRTGLMSMLLSISFKLWINTGGIN